MAALDLLGRRWSLRVLWELRDGARSFRALREACDDVSPTVLNARLKELREAGLVAASEAGYATTAEGRDLVEALAPLNAWSERWASTLRSGAAAARKRGGAASPKTRAPEAERGPVHRGAVR